MGEDGRGGSLPFARRARALVALVLVAGLVAVLTLALGPGPKAGAQTETTGTTVVTPGTAPVSTLIREERDVRVAIRVLEPFVVKTDDGRYSGFSIDLWEQIALRDNYRTTYVETKNVGEMLDAVRTGRADLAITAISITAEREQTVDFSEPMFDAGLQIAIPESAVEQTGGFWQTFDSPLILGLLFLMLASVLIAAVVVWIIERRDNPDFQHQGMRGVFEGLWWAVVTLLTVGYGDKVTKSMLGRAFSMLFMAYGVLLVATFTATFSANLTVRGLQTDVNGVSDLAGRKVATVKDTTAATYLHEHNVPALELDTVDELIGRLNRAEVDAGVYDAPVLQYEARPGNGGHIRLVGPPFTREYYGIAGGEGSVLMNDVNLALLRLYDDGTYDRIHATWFGA